MMPKVDFTVSKTQLVPLLKQLAAMNDEVGFEFNRNGMKLQTVDPAHVTMNKVKVMRRWFEEYRVAGEKWKMYALDVREMLRHVARVPGPTVRFTITHEPKGLPGRDHGPTLGETHGVWAFSSTGLRPGHVRVWGLCGETAGLTTAKWPDLKLACQTRVPLGLLKDAVATIAGIKGTGRSSKFDHIKAEYVRGKTLRLTTPDENSVGVELELPATPRKGARFRALFSADYFADTLRHIFPIVTEVMCHYGDDYPQKMVFRNQDSSLVYQTLLAPRIESE